MNEITQTPRTLSLWNVFREAARLTHGSLKIFLPVLLFIIISSVLLRYNYALTLIHMYLFVPGSIAAIAKLSIERARRHDISLKMALIAFVTRLPSTLGILFFSAIVVVLPLIVFFAIMISHPPIYVGYIILGIALIYALMMLTFLSPSLLFVVDKTFNPFMALEYSFSTVKGKVLKMLVLMLAWLAMLITILKLPANIHASIIHGFSIMEIIYLLAMIWVIPFLALCYGVMYHKLVD